MRVQFNIAYLELLSDKLCGVPNAILLKMETYEKLLKKMV